MPQNIYVLVKGHPGLTALRLARSEAAPEIGILAQHLIPFPLELFTYDAGLLQAFALFPDLRFELVQASCDVVLPFIHGSLPSR